jgi:ppGpp synthetase/RelA/SpoT-type nucleotidyltranferase
MNSNDCQELEKRLTTPRRVELVSNMNGLRTGQLMDMIARANRRLDFLEAGKQVILVERNHDYLDEILAKVLPEICPNHLLDHQDHHLPHYVVRDGRVEVYKNLDYESQVALVRARVKHPDSIGEKVPRKAELFGRVSERHDKYKLMVGDIIGLEVVARNKELVPEVTKQILEMPFLKLEHFEQHRKNNGYTSDHLNLVYENGNPEMKGLEIEVQVTDLQSHLASINDPLQGHETSYGAEKLSSRHHLDGQLIIIGNSVEVPAECGPRMADGLLVAEVKHPFKPYTIIVPKHD